MREKITIYIHCTPSDAKLLNHNAIATLVKLPLVWYISRMSEGIIDLRERVLPSNQRQAPLSPARFRYDRQPAVEWTAPEYVAYEYKKKWYIIMTGFTILMVIWGIFSKSYFFLTFIILAFALMLIYARRKPNIISFSLTGRGVQTGKKFYGFSDLKSFWIFQLPTGDELSLETQKSTQPTIRIPLGNADPEAIRDTLLQYLPEKEHKEALIDQLARSFGF